METRISPASAAIGGQISWQDVQIIEANELTIQATRYEADQQAPCRLCSDVRRDLTDKLILGNANLSQSDSSKGHIVARGLHVSDTSISALWRYTMGNGAAQDMLSAGKGRPVSHLYRNVYLAKPLYYVREFESQQYADMAGYRRSCCGCPACRYPSRRDIVEESIAGFLRSPLWEFDEPGMDDLLSESTPADTVGEIKRRSEPGIETKRAHLPKAFATATAKKYPRTLEHTPCSPRAIA